MIFDKQYANVKNRHPEWPEKDIFLETTKLVHLEKRDKICYTVQSDGHVFLSKVDEIENDPVINEFLSFIATDMKKNPGHLTAIDQTLVNRVQSLVSQVEIDLDAPLSNEDELTQFSLNNKRELPYSLLGK